jgi:hypothetical protein
MVIASVGQIPGWAGANHQFWVKGPTPFCKFEEPDSDSNIVSIWQELRTIVYPCALRTIFLYNLRYPSLP